MPEPEPGRLISFRVANGEEASSALLDALTELCWSGRVLVKKQDKDAAEGSQLLKHADPINGMDFLAPAGVAGMEMRGRGGGDWFLQLYSPQICCNASCTEPHCASLQV